MAEESSDDSGLDPEIEQLLDEDPDEESDTSLETDASVEQDVDDDTEPPADPTSDEDIEDSTSWTEILDPPEDLPDDQRVIESWGRFWGEIEDVAAAFYLIVNPISNSIQTLRLAVYGNPTQLEDFHPRMDAEQFEHRILEYNVQGQAIPKVIYDQVDEGLRSQLSEESMISQFNQFIVDQDREYFSNWFEELLEDVIEEGPFEFQVRAKFSKSPENVQDGDAEEPPDTATSADSDSGSREETSEEPSDGGQLDVSLVTSPSKGIPAEELEEGMETVVRIVDEKVEHLPDKLLDEERSSQMSIPLDATVKEINRVTQLPARIKDGEPMDYREVIVELEETVDGRALVYLEDRIKLQEEDDDEVQEMDEDMVNFLLLLGALVVVILTLVILF